MSAECVNLGAMAESIYRLAMTLHDESHARARDHAIDFAARREREERRSYARRPKKIGDVVAQLIAKRGYGRHQTDDELAAAWAAAAGKTLAAVSRAGKIQRGTLEVWVTNSTAMQEFTFQKERILAELNRTLPTMNIRGLKFRVGTIQ
jgi:predicted nucleic acid-binding Zn ribbon protein